MGLKRNLTGLVVLLLCILHLGQVVETRETGIQLIATVSSVRGKVEVRRERAGEWKAVFDGAKLRAGDMIRTGKKGTCVVKWLKGNALKIMALTTLKLDRLEVEPSNDIENTVFDLGNGKIYLRAKRLIGSGSRLEIKTPTAIAGVRGTRFSVDVGDGQETIIECRTGRIRVEGKAGGVVDVDGGWKVSVEKGMEPGEPEKMKDEDAAYFDSIEAVSAPTLDTYEPIGHLETGQTPQSVRGRATPGSKVTVNGKEVELDAEGGFSTTVDLEIGSNWIQIEAISGKGYVSRRIFRVKYFPNTRIEARRKSTKAVAAPVAVKRPVARETSVVSEGLYDEAVDVRISFPGDGYATKDSTVIIAGQKSIGAALTINGETVVSKDAGRGGFSSEVALTKEGLNAIEVRATRGGESKTTVLSITRDTISPRLEITQPLGQFDVKTGDCVLQGETPYCSVVGWTEPDAILLINDVRFEIESDGSFSHLVPFDPSRFVLRVSAEDAVGNRTTRVITRMPIDESEIAYLTLTVSPGSIVADNVSSATLMVTALNHYLKPVNGTQVALSAPTGDGSLSASSITMANGTGSATFYAGVGGGARKTITITATAGSVTAVAYLTLLPDFPSNLDD